MTKVTIDIRNIASSTHADDRVIFRSPTHRAGGAGLISTANEVVILTDGIGDVELTPGPVIVTFQCKGVTDTSPKRGTVPDTGPVPLVDVISGSFSYTPEVTTATQAARDGAVEAAGQAKDYRDTTLEYRNQAASSLSGAQDLASSVSDDVAAAVSAKNDAASSASAAAASASQAATSKDAAVQAASDTASALDGRIPSNLALRLDTTVGTRIFAGNTMIFGDTGLRTLVSWDTTGTVTYGTMPTGLAADSGRAGGIWIKRVREKVTMFISGAITTLNSGVIGIPTGFFPTSAPYPTTLFAMSTGYGRASIGGGKIYTVWTAGAQIPASNSSAYASTITWDVFTSWPTSLPGLPL